MIHSINRTWMVIFALFLSFSCSKLQVSKTHKSASSSEEKTDLMDLQVKKHTLDNGLRVLIFKNSRLPILSYYTFYDVGGRHEQKGKNTGATHFLEHMLFKGSPKFPGKSFFNYIEGVGGNTNAYTSFDSTVYYQNIPSSGLNTVMAMEADRMNAINMEPELLAKERQVVFEERKQRYENSPSGELYLKTMQAIFKGTPYGGSVIGEIADLKSLTRENLLDFHRQFYVPNNAIVVITGDVDVDDTIKMVEKYYGDLKPNKSLVSYKEEKDNASLYKHHENYPQWIKIKSKSQLPLFRMVYRGESLTSNHGFALDMLSTILGDGESSFLHQKYVKGRRPQTSSIGAYSYRLKHNGMFMIYGQLLGGKSLKSLKNNLSKDLIKSCDTAINERSLQKAKNQYLVDYYKGIQTNNGMASFLGLRENFFGSYDFYKKEIEIYNNLTVEQIRSACKDLFKDKKSIFASSWFKH
ncbi:MAG: M16 family metallopeptidase [Bacteriovoracaceae bacterium]